MKRLGELWDRAAPYIAGLALVLVMVFAGVVVWQNYNQHQFTVSAHNKSVAQQDEIIKILNEHTDTLSEVKQLRSEFTAFLNTEGPAVTAGQTALLNKLTWIECSLASGPASCGPKP